MTGTKLLWQSAVKQLRDELVKVCPSLVLNSHPNYLLSLCTEIGWGILALTTDELDLAPGSLHALGLSIEERAAVASVARDWRDRCARARKTWVWRNRPRGNAEESTPRTPDSE